MTQLDRFKPPTRREEMDIKKEQDRQETENPAPIIMDDADGAAEDFDSVITALLSRISELETEVKNLGQQLNGR